MLQPYPCADLTLVNSSAVKEIDWLMSFLLGIRRIRGEMNILPGKPLSILLQDGTAADLIYLSSNNNYLLKLGILSDINLPASGGTPPDSAIAIVGELKI